MLLLGILVFMVTIMGDMQGARREGKHGTMTLDNLHDLQQHILANVLVLHPFSGFGKAIDQKLQMRGTIGVKVDEQRLEFLVYCFTKTTEWVKYQYIQW